jgi:hypothetical protein
MSGFSSSEEEDELWVPFADRPGFADVVPLPQNDPPAAPVAIAYSPRFVATMDVLRALIAADELSERSLRVTRAAIRENAADYTAWRFRRRVLDRLDGVESSSGNGGGSGGGGGGTHWRREFAFTEAVAEESPKNYQLWHHRRAAVERVPSEAAAELAFTAAVLSEDAKNYHVWAHRQWVVSHFDLWGETELAFTATLIRADPRNNSALCHRLYALRGLAARDRGAPDNAASSCSSGISRAVGGNAVALAPEVCAAEADFALPFASAAPGNEAIWSYLCAIALDGCGAADADASANGAKSSANPQPGSESAPTAPTAPTAAATVARILAAAVEARQHAAEASREHAAACEVELLEVTGRTVDALETARSMAANAPARAGWWALRVAELEQTRQVQPQNS